MVERTVSYTNNTEITAIKVNSTIGFSEVTKSAIGLWITSVMKMVKKPQAMDEPRQI